MIATAFLAGLWTASRRAPRTGISAETLLDLGPWLILGGVLGARLFFVITFWNTEFAHESFTHLFAVWQGGLVYYGGLIGASLGTLIYMLRKQLPVWKLADVVAPSIALGSMFGRIGCFLNGCCFGRACTLPWAVHFPPGNDSYPQAVHPTQIYDALLNLTLYGFLAWVYRRKRFDGQVFGLYLVGYAVFRFIVEMFRGDYPPNQLFLGGWATPAQLVSMGMLVTGAVLLLVLGRIGPSAKASVAKQG